MIAHVQVRGGLPATEGCYSAWRALDERGWTIVPFEQIGEVTVSSDQPVIGGLDHVATALASLGVESPDVDYPTALKPFLLDPAVETRTLGWARTARDRWPLFMKPAGGSKEFTGFVLRSAQDLAGVAHIDDDLDVFVARPVDLRSRVEWRAFVIDGKVRDIRPYSACADGDAPAVAFVQTLANQWNTIPAGCSIDVVNLGTRARPDWRVVECNDGYALATYGLFRGTYGELLVKRWAELTSSSIRWV